MAGDWSEEITHVAGTDLAIIKGGQGKPLLVLHEEMGHPGWLNWHAALAKERTLIIPIQPGFGKSPRVEAIRNVHELRTVLLMGAARHESRSARRDRILARRMGRGRDGERKPADSSARWCWSRRWE